MKRITFAVLILMSWAASGLADSFGMAITANVPRGDRLNVRIAPNADAEILNSFPNYLVLDTFGTTDDGKWTRIAVPEGTGWVSSHYLKEHRMSFESDGMPTHMRCFGAEPFWSFDLLSLEASFSSLGNNELKAVVSSSHRSRNVGRASVAFQAGEFTGILTYANCSDGMSDRPYPWVLNLMGPDDDNALLTGCCTAADIQPN